jgi:hypothetical protein
MNDLINLMNDELKKALDAIGAHVWFEKDDLTSCCRCGIVRRADGKNKPCRGAAKLRPMEGTIE